MNYPRDDLRKLFISRYSGAQITSMVPGELYRRINDAIGLIDAATEGFLDASKQRDLSIKYHWGHNHDFGDGNNYAGRMGDRHIEIIARFITDCGLPQDLTGKSILDIGVWTGGTSLLLVAMGAEVLALEEVVKYAETVNLMACAFGIEERLKCLPLSLYDALPMFADHFDYVIYSGVIYHVSDPLLSLRLIFSALKDEGVCFIETYGFDDNDPLCRYEGPGVVHNGKREELNRGGWNYFVPSSGCLELWCKDVGFQEARCSEHSPENRLIASAKRAYFQDYCRAGFAQRHCR